MFWVLRSLTSRFLVEPDKLRFDLVIIAMTEEEIEKVENIVNMEK